MTWEASDVAVVEQIPGCNICEAPAKYDAKTQMGPWAYLCQDHFEKYGIQLGIGWGQRLEVRKDGERKVRD